MSKITVQSLRPLDGAMSLAFFPVFSLARACQIR